MKFKKTFESYEGEGPKIGMKTLFVTYDGTGNEFDWNKFYLPLHRPQAIYLNTEEFTEELINEISQWKFRFKAQTYEIGWENFLKNNYNDILDLPGSFFFRIENIDLKKIDCNKIIEISKNCTCSFKIEAKNENEFYLKSDLANFIVGLSENISVYLMPLYKEEVGDNMKYIYPLSHPSVRIMPPTQFLIDIK